MENILESVSPFGRFQKCVLFLIGTTSVLSAMTIYSTIFNTASPDIICFSKDKNQSSSIYNDCFIWESIDHSNTSYSDYECKFDTKYYGSSIITEWGLLCSKKYYGSLTQTFYMFGTLSSLIYGYFSDRFGRKKLSIILTILDCLVYILCETIQLDIFNLSVTTRYVIYSICQFLIGSFSNGLFVVTFVLLIELTTSKYNTTVSNINLYMYTLGELIVLVVAYLARDWHFMNWFISVYSIFISAFILFLLPESPRFLIQHKRIDEATQILNRIAKFNGKKENILLESELVEELLNKKDMISSQNNSKLESQTNDDNKIIFIILKSKSVILRAFLLSYVWFSIALVYYGVSLGITGIKNINPYMNYFFSSLSELIGYLFCYLNDIFKRKHMFIVFLGLASLTCLLVSIIPQEDMSQDEEGLKWKPILIILLTSTGKAMVSAAAACNYIYTSAMFPTNIRSTLFLFVSSIGKIGSIISPLINLAGDLLWKPLTYIIFGCSSFLGCLFIIILPDPEKLNYF